jgi:hypothetical protein
MNSKAIPSKDNSARLVRLFLFTFLFSLIATAALTIASSKAAAAGKVPDALRNADSRLLFEIGSNDVLVAPEVVAALGEIASEQAGIWGDTILEGDYLADGKTRLDRIEGLFHGDQLLAYRIRYSERAWYTGDCNPGVDRSRASCQEGRIAEASFVWPSLREWTVDDRAWAEFLP